MVSHHMNVQSTSVLSESPLLKNIVDTAMIRTVISGFRGPLGHIKISSSSKSHLVPSNSRSNLPPLAPRGGKSLARVMTSTTPTMNQRFRTSCTRPDGPMALASRQLWVPSGGAYPTGVGYARRDTPPSSRQVVVQYVMHSDSVTLAMNWWLRCIASLHKSWYASVNCRDSYVIGFRF